MTICVSFPTIMSGLVLRWYADEAAFAEHRELANASRESIMLFPGCPDELKTVADYARGYLKAEYSAHFSPRLDVSRWVTHRPKSLFSDELVPLAAVSLNDQDGRE